LPRSDEIVPNVLGAAGALWSSRPKSRLLMLSAGFDPQDWQINLHHPTGSFDSTKVRKVTFVRSDVLIASQRPAAPTAH
jgi:hypothetical protein